MFTEYERDVITEALMIVEMARPTYHGERYFTAASLSQDYVTLRFAGLEREEFHVIYLTAKHQMIKAEFLFQGTINECSVWPREIMKEALACNAAAVILCHNHPAGDARPSHQDENITRLIKQAGELLDVRVVDHIIVGKEGTIYSFATHGLL